MKTMASSFRSRLIDFQEQINTDIIDFEKLRKFTFRVGCPDDEGIRATVWKLLLNYLPVCRADWQTQLDKKRALYCQYIEDCILKPGSKRNECPQDDSTVEDHPLNDHPESSWSQYFQDNETLMQIDKDCRRLCPGLAFFQSASSHTVSVLKDREGSYETLRQRIERTALKAQNVSKNRLGITSIANARVINGDDLSVLGEGEEAHWEVAERILFIYVKLNPGQGYVQGMNEIIGPIYYVMAHECNKEDQQYAEHDAFWCFTLLMSEIRDNFIKTLDDSSTGIGHLMNKFTGQLKDKDVTLWLHLNEQDIKPQYYAFRWLTLLLSQEFELPNVLRLWDSLFADKERFDFLISVCCSMLILVRDELLKGDFANNMKLVQNFPSMDIHIILARAVELAGMR